MVQITHTTPPELLRVAEAQIGDIITECYACCGVDKVCKMAYESNIMALNAELVQLLAHPLSEITKNRTWLCKLLNARNYMEVFENVLFQRFETDVRITADPDFPKAEDLPHAISSDISSFSVWIMYHASPLEVRTMKRKDIELITKTEKKLGYSAFISVMVRAAIRFKILCQRVLSQALIDILRREKAQRRLERSMRSQSIPSIDDNADRFDTMSQAFASLKRA